MLLESHFKDTLASRWAIRIAPKESHLTLRFHLSFEFLHESEFPSLHRGVNVLNDLHFLPAGTSDTAYRIIQK